MKRFSIVFAFIFFNVTLNAQHFLTTWNTANSGASNSTSITIPTATYSIANDYIYNYDIDWENDGTFDDFGVTGSITHDYGAEGIYQVAIRGAFPAIHFPINGGDNKKIISIDQWGNINWKSMLTAFWDCSNLEYTATDSPDLTDVTHMTDMFYQNTIFNGDLSNWNTANVKFMSNMFRRASAFNGDVSSWNTSNVTNMSGIFSGASAFNGDISNWDVSNVKFISSMFSQASAFNGDISNWNTGSVTDMSNMFREANAFDGGIGNWNTSSVTNMSAMFFKLSTFNEDLSNWNTANVTNMSSMFSGASAFSGNIGNWDTGSVTDMSSMFREANAFDGVIGNWNTSSVTNMNSMFFKLSTFNGDLSNWNTGNVTNMSAMFRFASSFNGDISNWNTASVTTMNQMFASASTFNGDISNWNTGNVIDMTYIFSDASAFNGDLSDWNTGNVTNMFSMFFGASAFNSDLSNWNTVNVTNMRRMFNSASSFNADLSNWNTNNVTNMSDMFRSASSFNGNISTWNTSNVTTMKTMFLGASAFNSDLGSWDIANVTDMAGILQNCGLSTAYYDATLIGWAAQNPPSNLSPGPHGLTYCDGTTARSTLINTHGWTFSGDAVAAETEIEVMGNNMIIVEGDDTPSVTDHTDYGIFFFGATPFSRTFTINNNGPNSLNVSSVEISGTNTSGFVLTTTPTSTVGVGLSTTFTVTFTASIIGSNTATINIYNSDCEQTVFSFDIKAMVNPLPFLTTWNTANSGASNSTSVTIPTDEDYTYNYDIDWESDGTFDDFGVTGDITHDYGAEGTYQVAIRGTFPAMTFPFTGGDNEKIISIDQWGTINWKSMQFAFRGCSELGYTATDSPDLTDVTEMGGMFFNASSFNGDLSNWITTNITSMGAMFFGASSFNSNLSNWNVINVTNMSSMFYSASSFNSDLSNWNTANVTNMGSMFRNASSFNSDLNNWNTANVTDMGSMFSGASSFNGNISNWNTSNVTNMASMFSGVSSFNSDLSNWNIANVTNTSAMFYSANSFNRDLSNWNTGSVTNMGLMFSGASSFNGNISNWNTSNVTNMASMFSGVSSFNSDLSNWNTTNVTSMKTMFSGASSFNSDLGDWDITNVTDMTSMLQNCGLSTTNYDKTLIGWAAQNPPSDLDPEPSGLTYCQGATARDILINTYSWTFTGDAVAGGSEIEVKGNNVVIMEGDDTPSITDGTDFGAAVMGQMPLSQTFTINNTGFNPIEISSVEIIGANASDFAIITAASNTVSASSSTTFTVEFTPANLGKNTAIIEIYNTSDCNQLKFSFDIETFVLGATPSDKRGKMLDLNGSGEYVVIDNVATAMDGHDEFTLEAWFNADGTQSGNDRIISINTSSGGNVFLLYLDDGILSAFDGDDQDKYGSDLRGTGWHHVALSHNNIRDSVYLDGEYMGNGTFLSSVSTFSASNQWSIGQEYDGSSTGDYFKGKMDEVRIWKDVRTKKEIRENMHLTFSAAEILAMTNLVAYYQFDNDDAPETTNGVKDILGNHGTSVGGTYVDSEVAVGGGKSSRQTINTAGTFPFADTDIELTFTTAGGENLPMGEVVVTKIETEKPINVSANEMTNFPEEYWVINNYGTNNSNLGATVKFLFEDGQIDDDVVANHSVHKRESRQSETGDWNDSSLDDVSSAGGDNYITAAVTEFSQFSVSSNTSDFTAGGGSMSTITLALTTAASTDEDTGNFIFRFTRSGGDNTAILQINFGLSGTAENGDFTVTTGGTGLVTYTTSTKKGTITFPANETTEDLIITPTNDTQIEATETIVVTIEVP